MHPLARSAALVFWAIALIWAFGFSATSAVAGTPDFDSLETKSFRFLSNKECRKDYARHQLEKKDSRKSLVREITSAVSDATGISSLLEWVPDGAHKRGYRPYCAPRNLELLLLEAKGSARRQGNVIKEYFDECQDDLMRDSPGSLFALLGIVGNKYELCDNPAMKKFVVKLPSGDVLRGFLAMKASSKPRPMVILKCGVLCNAGDLSHRFMMMHLFDEAPFHVLAVGNITGADFVRDNGHVSLGGLDEGQQVIHLAKMIRSGPLAKHVSSVHYAGISLAGQAGLYAAHMAPYNTPKGDKPLLASVMSICPVVDLQPSMRKLFEPSFKGRIARSFYDTEVLKVTSFFPMLASLFGSSDDQTSLPDSIAKSAVEHYSSLKKGWALPPFENVEIRSREDLWKLNQFPALAKKPLKVPTLVFAAEDDMIVPTKFNAAVLSSVIGKHDSPAVVTVPSGNHCAFNQIYGWQTATSLFRTFVLSNSPELLARRKFKSIRFPTEYLSKDRVLYPDEKFQAVHYTYVPGADYLTVNFRIFSPFYSGCYMVYPYQGKPTCFREIHERIPFAAIPGKPSWARPARSTVDAEVLTRWANSNLMIVTGDKAKTLDGDSLDDIRFRWVTYD